MKTLQALVIAAFLIGLLIWLDKSSHRWFDGIMCVFAGRGVAELSKNFVGDTR